jgi:hypothetical protein
MSAAVRLKDSVEPHDERRGESADH